MSTQQFAGMPLIDVSLTDPTQGNSVTKQVDGKYVLRPSSLNISCPFSYAQNALLGKKSKPSGASAGGTAYHYALELGYKHKIATHTNPNMEDLVTIGVMNWREVQKVEPLHFAPNDDANRMEQNIIEGLRAYKPAMESIKPIATETRFTVALPKESSVYSVISGSVDLLAEAPAPLCITLSTPSVEIRDHKFTSKKSTEPKYKLQAGLYRLMGITNGYNVTDTVLDNMVRGKQLKTKYVPTSLEIVRPLWNDWVKGNIQARTNELIDRAEMWDFLKTDMGVDPEDAIKIVYPTTTPEVSYLCNELWCGWWDECPMNNPNMLPKVNMIDIIKQYRSKRGEI